MSVIQRRCAAPVCGTLSITLWLGLFAYAMRWSTLLCAEHASADMAAYADNWTTVLDLATGDVADEGTVQRHKDKFVSSEDSNVTKDAKSIRSNVKHCRREGTVPCVGAAYKALFQVISSVEASNALNDSCMLYHVCGFQGQLPAPLDGVNVGNVAPTLTGPWCVVEDVQLVDIAGCSQVSPPSNYRANGINASDVSVASGISLVAQLPAVEPSSTPDCVVQDNPLSASGVDTAVTRSRCGIANGTKTLSSSAGSHRVDSTEPKATEHFVFAMQKRTLLYSGTERVCGVVEDDHSNNFKESLGFQQEVAGPNTNPVVELLHKPEDSNKAKDANHRNPRKQPQQPGTMPCVGVTSMSVFQVTSGEALSTVQSINGCDLSVGSVGLPDEEFLLGCKQVVVTELNANMVQVFVCNHGGTSSTNGISFTRLVQVMLEEELGTALNGTLTFSHIIPDMGVPWTKVDGIHSIIEDDELPVGTTSYPNVFSNRLISDVLSFVGICEVASDFNNRTRTITCTDPSTAGVTFMMRVQPTLVVAAGTVLDGMSTFIHINQGILGELLRAGGGQHFVGICGTFVLANNLSDSDWPLNGNQPVIIITNVVCCINSHTNSCPGPVSLMNGHDVCLTSYDAQPATDPAPDVSIITNSVICAGLVPAMDQSGLSTCTSIFLLVVGKPDHQLSTEIDPNRTTALKHLWMGSSDRGGPADCSYTRPFIPSWSSTFEMSVCAWKSWQRSPCHGVKLVTDTDGVSFASTNAHNDPGCPINNVNLSNMPCTGHVANHSTMVISGLAVSVGVITLQNGIRLSNERSQSTQGGPGVKVDGVHPFIEINGVTVGITSCADLLTNWLVTDVQPRIGIYGVTSGFNDRTMVAVTCTDPTSAGVAFMMCVQPTLVEAWGTVLDGMSTFIHINQGILGELLRAGGGQPFVGICGTIAVVNDLSDSDWPFDGNQPATRVTPVACGVDSCAHSYTDRDSLIDGHGVCLTDYDVQPVADFAPNADNITNCTIDSAGLIPVVGHRAYNTCTGSHTSVYRLFVVKLDCNLTTKCDDDHPNPTTAQHKHPWTGIEGAGVLVAHFYTRLVSPNWPYYWKWISLYGGKIVTDADGVTSASSNACNDDVEPMDTSRNSQVAHACNGSANFINGCDVSAGVVTLVDLQLRSVKASDGHYIDQLDLCCGTVLSCSTAVPTVDCHSILNQSVMWRDGTNWLRVESSSGNSCTVAVVAAPRTVTEAFDDRVNGTSGHTIPNFATPASPGKGHDVAADDGTTLLLEGGHVLANPPSPSSPTRLLAMGWLLGSRADCARRRSIALSAMPCQSVTASSSVVNGDIAMWLTTMVALIFATIVLISPPLMVQLMACTVALMVGIGGYIMEPVLMGLGATSVAVGFVMSTNLVTVVVGLTLCVLMSLLLHDIHFELWTCAILSVAYWTCTTWIGWTMSLPVGGGLVCIAWWMRRSWLLFPDDSDASTQQTIFDWKPMAVQGYVCELLGLDLEKAKDNELNAKFERATGRALASASEQELNQDFGVDGVTAKSIYVGVSSILEKLKDSNDKRTAIGARSRGAGPIAAAAHQRQQQGDSDATEHPAKSRRVVSFPRIDFSSWETDARSRKHEMHAELKRYVDVGTALKETNCTIQDFVDSLMKDTALPRPFGVVDGPSGIGKTQQFFALTGIKVVYFAVPNWSAMSESNQDIYRVFSGGSKALITALELDMADPNVNLGKSDQIFPTASFLTVLQNIPMFTAGVILKLIRLFQPTGCDDVLRMQFGGVKSDAMECPPATFEELKQEVLRLQDAKQNNFLFVVDEVPGSGGTVPVQVNLAWLTFCRNIFRACGLALILAGTGSTVLNHMAGPSSTTENLLFCKAITKLAGPTMDTLAAGVTIDRAGKDLLSAVTTLDSHVSLHGFMNLILNARPRLAVWLTQAALAMWKDEDTPPCLDDVLDIVSARLFNTKKSLRHGLGQWRSFQQHGQYVDHGDDDKATRATRALVVGHMAHLFFGNRKTKQILSAADFVATGDGVQIRFTESGVDGSVKPYFPTLFPRVDFEPLLYMIIHGTRTTNAFETTHGVRHSTVTERWEKVEHETGFVDGGSSPKRSGDLLEAIVSVAWVVATRSHGLGGVPAGKFLSNLCSELSLGDEWVDLECRAGSSWDDFLGDLTKLFHPYAFHPAPAAPGAAPRCLVPDELCSGGRRLAQIWRSFDKEQHDLNVLFPKAQCRGDVLHVSAECKNRKEPLTNSLLLDCIGKIPKGSHIHLVVCDLTGPKLFKQLRHLKYNREPLDVQSNVTFEVRGDNKRCLVLMATREGDELRVHHVSKDHQTAWGRAGPTAPDIIVVVLSLRALAATDRKRDIDALLEE